MKFSRQFYNRLFKENEIKKPIIKNTLAAFISGGIICLIGEVILNILKFFDINQTDSTTYIDPECNH